MSIGSVFVYDFSEGSHRWVVISKSNTVKSKVLLVMATSQVEKRISYTQKKIFMFKMLWYWLRKMNIKVLGIAESVH